MSSIEDRLAAAGLPPLPRTAWLEIDLDALRGNLAALRALAGTGVPVHPVVKADAYGHGAVPVALALEAAGADGFCVAALDEALALRAGGIRGPIRVLYPIPVALAGEAARQGVTVAGGDLGSWRALLEAAEAAAATDAAEPLDVELEVETGLGRGGFAPEAARRGGVRDHRAPARQARGAVDPPPGERGPRSDRATSSRASRPRRRACATPGCRCLRAMSRPAAGCSRAWRPSTAYGRASSIYGIVPDELAGPCARPT